MNKKSKAGAKKKPYELKKHRVLLFVEGYKIKIHGGQAALKKHLYESIQLPGQTTQTMSGYFINKGT